MQLYIVEYIKTPQKLASMKINIQFRRLEVYTQKIENPENEKDNTNNIT